MVTAARAAGRASPVRNIRIRSPSETRSPTLTVTSATMPAAGEGTSIDALSDSSVISGSSALMVAPGSTWTSMISTSLKSPMSGTLTSIVLMGRSPTRSEHQPAHVLEHVAEMAGEARRERAVDHPVIVGERHRQHQPGGELRAVPHRRHLGAHDAE